GKRRSLCRSRLCFSRRSSFHGDSTKPVRGEGSPGAGRGLKRRADFDNTARPHSRTTMLHTTFRSPHSTFDRPLCRLGLATRGTNRLTPTDIRLALDRGVNFLNWCGTPDGLSETIAALGPRRREVMVCVQFEARTAADAHTE